MGELEDQLNSILSDPRHMEQIAGLARSLMGGDGPAPEQPTSEPGIPGLDPGLLRRLGQAMQSGGDGREQALLRAMQPYLSEKRRDRMERALKLAQLARIARLAAEGTGGGDNEPL